MGLFEQLPYTNFHELNLVEIVKMIKELAREMEQFEVVNKISYGGDWDITKQYSPWTVVCVNGTEGYISIQPVPIGIDYTNTDYWRLVADFTVQLAGIGQRVTDLENDSVIVHSDITNLQNGLTHTNNMIKSWAGRRVLWVGDSYGNGWDGSQSVTDPYTYASNLLGCSFVNISVGGTRFGTSGGATYQYKTHIEDYVNNHTDMDTFTDVIIIGGANDITFNPNEDLSTPIQSCVNYVKTNFPNAKIRIGMVARMVETGSTNATLFNVWNVADKYRLGAVNNGVEYISRSELINHNYALLANDGIHLTSYTQMGEKLASLLTSGDFKRYNPTTLNYYCADTDNDNLKPSTITAQTTTYRGNTVLLDISDLQFDFSPSKALTWGKTYKFAKISGGSNCRNMCAAGGKAIKTTIPCSVVYTESGNTYRNTLPINFYFYDNYLWLSFKGMLPSGSINLNATTIFVRDGIQFAIDENFC